MKRLILTMMFIVVGSIFVNGQTEANNEKEVGQVLDQMTAGLTKNDPSMLERIYADDYTLVTPNGRLMDKKTLLGDLKSGTVKFDAYAVEDRRIRLHGDTAIVTSRLNVKGVNNKQDISGQYRITAMLMKMDGQWRLMAVQSTRIAEP